MAYLGDCPFTRTIVAKIWRILKGALTNPSGVPEALTRIKNFLVRIFNRPNMPEAVKEAWGPESTFEAAERCTETFGTTFDDAVVEVIGDVGDDILRAATEVLDTLPDTAKNVIKNSPLAKEAMEGLARALKAGVNGDTVRAIFNANDGVPIMFHGTPNGLGHATTYTEAYFLKDLGDLAPVADARSLNDLLGHMTKNMGDGVWGIRYEFQGNAALAKGGGGPVIFINEFIRNNDATIGNTDVDSIAKGIYHQLKWRGEAFKGKAIWDPQQGKEVYKSADQQIVDWVKKVRAHAAGLGQGAPTIKYVTPNAQAIPPSAKKALKRELGGVFSDHVIQLPFEPPL